MAKGNILIVVNIIDKKIIEEVTVGTNLQIDEVSDFCQFSLEDLEVDFKKNPELANLQSALDSIGEDNYACCITVERLETLEIYGSPKKFGLINVMNVTGYTVTVH
jgi:hypothetical protein